MASDAKKNKIMNKIKNKKEIICQNINNYDKWFNLDVLLNLLHIDLKEFYGEI